MPVFNACRTDVRFLREAVASVIGQTRPPLELLIVDDGSTDDTFALCRELAAAPGPVPIEVLRTQHGGQSSARNAGIGASRGEYVSFIDQDDVWYPDKLERIAPQMGCDVDLVYTDADTIDAEGHDLLIGLHRNYGHGWPHPKRNVEDILLTNVFVMPGVMTVRRELLLRLGGFDELLSGFEDDDLFLRIFLAGTVAYLGTSTLRWRKHCAAYSLSAGHVRSRLRYWEKLIALHAAGGRDRRRAGAISARFFRESLRQAIAQRRAGNPLWEENLTAARAVAPNLPGLERFLVGRFAARWCSAAARRELVRRMLAAWWRLTPLRHR